MTDVFVSYARSDRPPVEPLAHALKALGLQVFFDIEAIDGGDAFPDVIDKEVKSASVVLGCWTPQALTRTHAARRAGRIRLAEPHQAHGLAG